MDPDVLTDSSYRVPSQEAGAAAFTVGWLRREVARFRDGDAHAPRRAAAVALLNDLDTEALREAAATRTAEIAAAADGPFDAMERVARRVPVLVLADHLGFGAPATTPDLVGAIAAAYQPDSPATPEADDAVRTLAHRAGPDAAARIGLLVQAYEATAALIGNAVLAGGVEKALAEGPPVRRTRRIGPDGDLVPMELAGAPFGAGAHRCPGEEQARALAEGVTTALLDRCLPAGDVRLLSRPVRRLPMAAR